MIKLKREWIDQLSTDAILELLQHPNRKKTKYRVKRIKEELFSVGFHIVSSGSGHIKIWTHNSIITDLEDIQQTKEEV